MAHVITDRQSTQGCFSASHRTRNGGSEGPRGDAEELDAGTKALALMNATIMARDSKFRPPTIHGITKKNADGSLSHIVNLACRMEVRVVMFADLTVLGPDGKVVENDSPTEGEVALALSANNEHFARALLIYGSLEQNWGNLYKVLDAMREGNGVAGLRAKNFVPAPASHRTQCSASCSALT